MTKTILKGMNLKELQEFVEALGEKKYRARQLYVWMYGKLVQSFDAMTDVSKEFRAVLEEVAAIETLTIAAVNESKKDGASKYLFELSDGLAIESVLIPSEVESPRADNRLTVCISTQVGCPLDCKFCATGTMGFKRNLTAGEIVEQVLSVQRLSSRRISNVVYMGMGEPMLNYENVMRSVEIITSDDSLNIGQRHITISTAGIVEGIKRMADEHRKVKLALSLHTLDDERRAKLMPINKKNNVADLLKALEYYYNITGLRPTLEYIPFAGFNDRDEDIRLLTKASKKVPLKVNLIPYHSIEFAGLSSFAATLRPSSRERMESFAQSLRDTNLTVMIRSSAGEDINAACGQLAVIEGRNKKKR